MKYSITNYNPEHMAKATGRALPISTKQSVEICNFIRKKGLQKAKTILNNVIAKKAAIPLKRYNRSIGHKTGMAVGRYPVNACKEILSILESVEANAQVKGLNTSNLVINHIAANKAGKQMHYGRQRGRIMKRTHIEVVVEEKAEKKKVKEKPKAEGKKEVKEEKKAEKETVKKEEEKATPTASEKPAKVAGKEEKSKVEEKKK